MSSVRSISTSASIVSRTLDHVARSCSAARPREVEFSAACAKRGLVTRAAKQIRRSVARDGAFLFSVHAAHETLGDARRRERRSGRGPGTQLVRSQKYARAGHHERDDDETAEELRKCKAPAEHRPEHDEDRDVHVGRRDHELEDGAGVGALLIETAGRSGGAVRAGRGDDAEQRPVRDAAQARAEHALERAAREDDLGDGRN
jgi:hypothetical protein